MNLKKICIAASLLVCTSAYAQESAKVLQVMRGNSVIASFNLTPDMTLSIVGTDAEEADANVASANRVAPFPEDDGSKNLANPVSAVSALRQLVDKMDRNRALEMGETEITAEQFAEIKKFVDENLAGADGTETYENIFKWITTNIKYAWSGTPAYLKPYDVFTYKTCVCQGYANLLKTMMITQGLPAFIANGWLGTVGGHAWNYVYDGKKWIVSDPTNGNQFNMSSTSTYSNKLIPKRADLDMFEDETFCYGFEESHVNINEVKAGVPDELTIPFGVAGFRISQFLPNKALPENVRSISLGKNVRSLGEYVNMLAQKTPNLEEIAIDPTNSYLKSYKGVVYKGSSSVIPYFIPPAMKRVELKPMKTMGKNVIYDLPAVEEIVIAEGTEVMEAYAIENCPNLRRVYVPELTKVEKDALYRCPNAEIIQVATGIKDIRM